MATIDDVLTIRSAYARARAGELARRTGMTQDQVVEEALRAYAPAEGDDVPAGLVRRGGILVRPAEGRRTVTFEEAEEAIEAARNDRC